MAGITKRWVLLALLLPLVAWESASPWRSFFSLKKYHEYMLTETANWTAAVAESSKLLTSSIAFLEMWDWEQEAFTKGTCSPPAGVPLYCCPSGQNGTLDYRNQQVCLGTTRQQHESVKTIALKYLHHTQDFINKDIMACDICRVVELLYSQSLSMTMSGDSVMRQSAEAFQCALARRGYATNMVVYRGIGRVLSIKSSQWTHSVNVTIYNTVRGFRPNAKDLKERPADVLLHNDGLHQGNPKRYKSSMQNWFQKYSAGEDGLDSIRLYMFRETSAQHFDAPEGGGYWERNQSSTAGCVPLRWGPLAGWREPIVRNGATNANVSVVMVDNDSRPSSTIGHREVVVLPFYNYTAEFHDFHFSKEDCSHFCQSPFFWLQQWRSMRLTMDRSFG